MQTVSIKKENLCEISKKELYDILGEQLKKEDYKEIIYSEKEVVKKEIYKVYTEEKFIQSLIRLGIKKGFLHIDEKSELCWIKGSDEFYFYLKAKLNEGKVTEEDKNEILKDEIKRHNRVNGILYLFVEDNRHLFKKIYSTVWEKETLENEIKNLKELYKEKAECLKNKFKELMSIYLIWGPQEAKCFSTLVREWLEEDSKREAFFCRFIAYQYDLDLKKKKGENSNNQDYDATHEVTRRCLFLCDFSEDEDILKKIKEEYGEENWNDDDLKNIICRERKWYGDENYELSRHEIHSLKNDIVKLEGSDDRHRHFVVGDLHEDVATLKKLMEKIKYCRDRDHIYFVGDYYSALETDREIGYVNIDALMDYMDENFEEDYSKPGFHMICGNHEWQKRVLENLPDIIVLKLEKYVFFMVHAAMYKGVYELIKKDVDDNNDESKKIFLYKLDREKIKKGESEEAEKCWCMIWSEKGNLVPDHEKYLGTIQDDDVCVIHGHTPYGYFNMKKETEKYGRKGKLWKKEHIWFSEDMHSFDIDANIKGGKGNERGLACLCLDVLDNLPSISVAELYEKSSDVMFYVEKVEEKQEVYEKLKNGIPQKKIQGIKIITVENDEIKFK